VAAATPKSGHREVAWAKQKDPPHGAPESLIKPWAEKRHASRGFLACQQLLLLGVAFACGAAAGVTATTHTCTFAGWTALYLGAAARLNVSIWCATLRALAHARSTFNAAAGRRPCTGLKAAASRRSCTGLYATARCGACAGF
jgi:hypothetical protein